MFLHFLFLLFINPMGFAGKLIFGSTPACPSHLPPTLKNFVGKKKYVCVVSPNLVSIVAQFGPCTSSVSVCLLCRSMSSDQSRQTPDQQWTLSGEFPCIHQARSQGERGLRAPNRPGDVTMMENEGGKAALWLTFLTQACLQTAWSFCHHHHRWSQL